jgi:hypothetical protein
MNTLYHLFTGSFPGTFFVNLPVLCYFLGKRNIIAYPLASESGGVHPIMYEFLRMANPTNVTCTGRKQTGCLPCARSYGGSACILSSHTEDTVISVNEQAQRSRVISQGNRSGELAEAGFEPWLSRLQNLHSFSNTTSSFQCYLSFRATLPRQPAHSHRHSTLLGTAEFPRWVTLSLSLPFSNRATLIRNGFPTPTSTPPTTRQVRPGPLHISSSQYSYWGGWTADTMQSCSQRQNEPGGTTFTQLIERKCCAFLKHALKKCSQVEKNPRIGLMRPHHDEPKVMDFQACEHGQSPWVELISGLLQVLQRIPTDGGGGFPKMPSLQDSQQQPQDP